QWNGRGWTKVGGGAVRIAVGPRGEPYVVNAQHQIFQWNGRGGWNTLPGAANDISVGADGTIYVTGNDNVGGNHTAWKWNGKGWTNLGVQGVNIAGGPHGEVWLTTATKNIMHGNTNAAAVVVRPAAPR